MDKNIDIGFLMDDDVEYKLNCMDKYVESLYFPAIYTI